MSLFLLSYFVLQLRKPADEEPPRRCCLTDGRSRLGSSARPPKGTTKSRRRERSRRRRRGRGAVPFVARHTLGLSFYARPDGTGIIK